ncbi:uncharacterized protein F5147DRAFT_816968, partial [Suillus discolor]
LTAEDIKRGLGLTAKHLKSKKKQITVVAVGGAINMILLRAYSFNDLLMMMQLTISYKLPCFYGGCRVDAENIALGEGWTNNHTALFIAPNTKTNLYNEAISDGVVIFDEPGLQVLAAPWMYCLVAKLEKAEKKGNAKSYDMSDASQYLIQESKRRGAKIKVADIEAKAIAYGAKIQEAQIKELKALCGGYVDG